MTDALWDAVDGQIKAMIEARTGAEVITLCKMQPDEGQRDGFFFGDGDDMWDALDTAGWRTVWFKAAYYWQMRAPDDSTITYVEGDLYLNDGMEGPM